MHDLPSSSLLEDILLVSHLKVDAHLSVLDLLCVLN